MSEAALFDIFVRSIKSAPRLPQVLRENAERAKNVEESRFDESYIEFLDTQIELNGRGDEWTARLKKRRVALIPFCNLTYIRGRVEIEDARFTIDVDPRDNVVFHWEEY